jgi:hypothetical protein
MKNWTIEDKFDEVSLYLITVTKVSWNSNKKDRLIQLSYYMDLIIEQIYYFCAYNGLLTIQSKVVHWISFSHQTNPIEIIKK